MPFQLRPFQEPNDYVALSAFYNQLQPGSSSPEDLAAKDKQIPAQSRLFLDENQQLGGFGRERIVAESADTGESIGYAQIWRAPWTPPGCLATLFYVAPAHRGQGVGTALLTHLLAWAKQKQADTVMSELKDWVPHSLDFALKQGFALDAHIFELHLDVNAFDESAGEAALSSLKQRGITFCTLGDIAAAREQAEEKLYRLYAQTLRDNPGHVGELPDLDEWRREAFPSHAFDPELVFIAADGERFVGVTTVFHTDQPGIKYTDYTGVDQNYRGQGIATALKLLSIQSAKKRGAHTLSTETEAKNSPMQAVNRKLGYVPGKGHYRVVKHLHATRDTRS
ncbi:GNAT family N-acetyltransferase [Brevibacillus choshinensis]|uniref:GNAT family N-acetyltransferase n=1 Tax=Brevibacillus choshinensis TaxID=54911 RepID=A0ABX7FS02_BRECH|nr:GNAT family N-acetyltransferase [Brevibacillus choshinensis]QRG68412.1 GNAT family N-acetyltransferase [Brevibacillus choshinensis]